ncbi:MAG TPA: hypothetical protein VN706_18005 [Gemmatimonadaceae bacterium]|nr:hypothetical protein [Gemmatimonadaceae bacterium]
MRETPQRLRTAFGIAPLAAPLAVFVAVLARAASNGGRLSGPTPATPASLLVLLWVFMLFGAPLAYAATVIVLWPATVLLRHWNLLRWWTLATIGALAGTVLLRAYAALLQPNGTIDLVPGAGAIAGAAVALALWWMGLRGARRDV